MTEPTETKSISRRAASIGRRETEGKNGLSTSPPVKYYWTVSGKSKRLQEYLQLLFPPTHSYIITEIELPKQRWENYYKPLLMQKYDKNYKQVVT